MKNRKIIIKSILSFIIVLIPSLIEKFCFPNEIIFIPRFVLLQLLAFVIVLFIFRVDFNYKSILEFIIKAIKTIKEYWNKFINMKIINKLFIVLPHNLIIFIFFIISLFYITNFYINKNDEVLYGQPISDAITGPIINEEQYISFDRVELNDKVDKFCVQIATYGKKIKSDYRFELYKNNELIKSELFNTSNVVDNQNYCFDINELEYEKVKDYHAKIIPVNTNIDNVITLYKDSQTDEVAMYFVQTKSLISVKTVLLIICFLIFFIINYFINKKKIAVENMWLIMCLAYVLPIMFIIPPYQVPDEPYHFVNSIQMSQINDIDFHNYILKGEISVPENYECLDYSKLHAQDSVNDLNDISNCFRSGDNKIYNMGKKEIALSFKLGYIVSSIGVKLADIITNNPMIIFFLGRLFNLLLSIVIIYYAIKITPRYKEMFMAVGLMPMFVQQMISYSYDSVLNSICLLVMAICLKLTTKDKIDLRKYYIILFISALLITNIKVVYLPLMLFMILANESLFKDKKGFKYLYIILAIILPFVIGSVVHNIVNINYSTGLLKDPTNFNNVLHNPLSIFTIAINTFNVFGMYYLRGLVGYFGWFKFRMEDIFVYAYIIYFAYLVLSNSSVKFKKGVRAFLIICILFMIGAVFGALYFDFTAANQDYVSGVQGRYFLPLLIPLLMLVMPRKNKLKYNIDNSYYFTNIVMLQYILMLLIFYY